jgi:hypothetical protein
MKALKPLAILLLAIFSYGAVSAQPRHEKKHYKKHHVVVKHRHHRK